MEEIKKDFKKEKPKKQSVYRDVVEVTFKENRKFDLHVGRKLLTFKGREKKTIPKEWLDHPDFQQVNKMFIVRGI